MEIRGWLDVDMVAALFFTDREVIEQLVKEEFLECKDHDGKRMIRAKNLRQLMRKMLERKG